jgi:hypothetical protein
MLLLLRKIIRPEENNGSFKIYVKFFLLHANEFKSYNFFVYPEIPIFQFSSFISIIIVHTTEKRREFNLEMHIDFIDYEEAFDDKANNNSNKVPPS